MKQLEEKLIELAINTPQILGACFFSFLSGHVWLWFIYAYFKKKDDEAWSFLDNRWAKTGLGILWNVPFLFVYYIVKYGLDTNNAWSNILSIIPLGFLIGLSIQPLVVILIIVIFKNK